MREVHKDLNATNIVLCKKFQRTVKWYDEYRNA